VAAPVPSGALKQLAFAWRVFGLMAAKSRKMAAAHKSAQGRALHLSNGHFLAGMGGRSAPGV
jgi:hypothetical protein